MSIVIATQLEYLVPMAEKPVYFASEGGAEPLSPIPKRR